jgi:hypothetical protein
MFDTIKNKIIAVALTATFATTGYGALYLADNRYVQQKDWVQESRNAEQRQLQYRIDELEWQEDNTTLTPKESWELKQLKSQLRRLK